MSSVSLLAPVVVGACNHCCGNELRWPITTAALTTRGVHLRRLHYRLPMTFGPVVASMGAPVGKDLSFITKIPYLLRRLHDG